MNYYEELAVAQNASIDEIHQAYRALARLLHPDNQSDQKLRSAAERQMIRLNEILATLADSGKRRKYDESLCNKLRLTLPEAAPPPLAPTLRLHQLWPWILAFGILAGVGLWYLRSNESGDTPSLARSVQPAPAAASEIPPPKSRNRSSKTFTPKRTAAPPRSSPARQDSDSGESAAPADPVKRMPEPGPPVAALQDEARESAARPVQPLPLEGAEIPAQPPRPAGQPGGVGFAGRWLYASGSHDPHTPGMYPPAFIELSLAEQQGVLAGRYWARYQIPDKPVSPEVQFRVNGAPQKGNIATLKWVSDDGANGQLKMVLRDSNSMEVTWWTTAFGGQMALTSGTAVLVRQQAR